MKLEDRGEQLLCGRIGANLAQASRIEAATADGDALSED